eukprot:7004981-Pyramimonas_sp.AAC.2
MPKQGLQTTAANQVEPALPCWRDGEHDSHVIAVYSKYPCTHMTNMGLLCWELCTVGPSALTMTQGVSAGSTNVMATSYTIY